jgi:hypothetical protein
MSRIRIALFNHRTEAQLLCERLIQAGIPAEIHVEPAAAWLWFVSETDAGVRLEVPTGKSGRATALLLEWSEKNELLRDAVRCPECHSLRVDYPQFTEKSFLPNLVMGLLARIGAVEKDYYCEYCHCMWAKPETKTRPVREHMAPNYFLEGLDQIQAAEQPAFHQTTLASQNKAAA